MTDQALNEKYYAGAYWGPRKESPEECAQRTVKFFELLSPCDPFLAHWYTLARSRRDARRFPVTPPDVATLTELFRRGVNREKGGPIFENLGFRVWFHNGGDDYEQADLRITCGCYSEAVSNACVLSLPSTGANADRLLSAPMLTAVMRSMALAWEPEWAVATSSRFRDLLSENGSAGTFVGWVTYQSRRRGVVPPLPTPLRIEPVESQGTLVVLTPERLTARNPAHVELGQRARALLDRAGLMQPVISS